VEFFTCWSVSRLSKNVGALMSHNPMGLHGLLEEQQLNDILHVSCSFWTLAVDKIIVPFKGWVIFKQYIPQKYRRFGMKIYKLCDMSGYTYNMDIYSGEDRTCVTTNKAATHTIVKQLTKKWNDMDMSYIWTVSFHCLTYFMMWQRNQSWDSQT
jgi:hypothetical protein